MLEAIYWELETISSLFSSSSCCFCWNKYLNKKYICKDLSFFFFCFVTCLFNQYIVKYLIDNNSNKNEDESKYD